MRIWLLQIGEPLPIDGRSVRTMRTGLLAEACAERGHDVTWWTSSFDHTHKRHRVQKDTTIDVSRGLRLRLLKSTGYRSNISLRRLRDHYGLARKFSAEAQRKAPPDIIVSSLPTLKLSEAAVLYARKVGCPVVLDVRDLWPDVFADLSPRLLRPLVSRSIWPLWRIARRACSGATSIVGVTDRFVEWGVDLAGRTRTPRDRVFPMAYPIRQPSPEELNSAAQFWRDRGISSEGRPFVGCFFGSINRHFEIPTIIAAARLLSRENRDFRFVICGVGEKLSEYKRLAAGCPQVVFPGWVDGAQIWTLMRTSDVGLVPYVSSGSFIGNIPNKPIEYLSAGLPILSSLQGALADLLAGEGCGITYPNGDAAGLATAVRGLMDNPAGRRRMAVNAARVFERRFVAEDVYREMEQYLVDLAGRKRRAAA